MLNLQDFSVCPWWTLLSLNMVCKGNLEGTQNCKLKNIANGCDSRRKTSPLRSTILLSVSLDELVVVVQFVSLKTTGIHLVPCLICTKQKRTLISWQKQYYLLVLFFPWICSSCRQRTLPFFSSFYSLHSPYLLKTHNFLCCECSVPHDTMYTQVHLDPLGNSTYWYTDQRPTAVK